MRCSSDVLKKTSPLDVFGDVSEKVKHLTNDASNNVSPPALFGTSPVRYVLKIHFFIEFGLKMIQFKIQFKTKSKIFIQKNIHSIESRIYNRIIHSKKMRKIIHNSQMRPSYGSGALLRPQYR